MEIESFREKIKSQSLRVVNTLFFLLKNLFYASAQAENKQNFNSKVKTYPG